MQEFQRFTDPNQMQALFREQLPLLCDGNIRLKACQVVHVRFREHLKAKSRHKSWLGVCYRLMLADRTDQWLGEQWLYGRARLDGASQAEYAAAMALWQTPPRFGAALTHLPALDMTLWAFPNDPQLPHLPQVMDVAQVRAWLPYAQLPVGFQKAAAIDGVEATIVHYYPEERCTTRYRLDSIVTDQSLILYGKTFKGEDGERIYTRMNHCWQTAQRDPTWIRSPQPLAYDPAIQTIWLAEQPGQPLLNCLRQGEGQTLLPMVAEGLAALHSGLNHPGWGVLPTIMPADLLLDAQNKVEKLANACPSSAAALNALWRRLQKAVPLLAPQAVRLIHGDFHTRQLLIHQGRVIFFDFDELAIGDPGQDMANFIVDLHAQGFPASAVQSMAHRFCEAYHRGTTCVVEEEQVRWHIQMQLLNKAYRAYRQFHPEREQVIAEMVGLAEHYQ